MLYNKYVKMHLKTASQYKANSTILILANIFATAAEFISIGILFSSFKSVGEWGFYETALMFGIITFSFSLAECFGRGFDEFASLIKNGDLDRLLVRPVNSIFQIFCSKIELIKLGRALFGLTICFVAIFNLGISWTFAKILVLIATFICGFLVCVGVMIIGAGISVFTVENLEFLNIITNGAKEISYYPINVYNKWLARFFTFIIPMACFNYLPLSYIMGYGNLPMLLCALSPVIGALFIVPCMLFFKWALKHYQSTGT